MSVMAQEKITERPATGHLYHARLWSEAGWLQDLAARLGCGGAAADDAVQETLLSAFHACGGSDGNRSLPSRGWLRTVLARRIRGDRQSSARRVVRESAVAREESIDLDPSAALERLESGAQLSRALARLPQRDREVLTLRFAAGLTPVQIAATLRETPNAISSRLSRALRQLRLELAPHDEPDSLRSIVAFPLSLAISLMKNKAAVVAIVTLATLALVPLVGSVLNPERTPSRPDAEEVTNLLAVARPAEDVLGRQELSSPAVDLSNARISLEASETEEQALPRESALAFGTVQVLVRESRTGAPAAGVGVEILRFGVGAPWNQVRVDATGMDGRVTFTRLRPGPISVHLGGASAVGAHSVESVEVRAREQTDVTFTVDATRRTEGLVVDEAGAPVAGAEIWLAQSVGPMRRGSTAATSDADGRFTVQYAHAAQFMAAFAPGYAPSRSAAPGIGEPTDDDGSVLLVLGARRGTLRGIVLDHKGQPVLSALVTAGVVQRRLEGVSVEEDPYWTTPMQALRTDDDGAFEFADVGVGPILVEARGASTVLWSETVEVFDGAVTEIEIELERGGSIEGRVRDAKGDPVPGVRITVDRGILGSLSPVEVISDGDGRFELTALNAGERSAWVDGKTVGLSTVEEMVLVTDGQRTRWDPVLPPMKRFRATVVSASREPLAGWGVSSWPIVNDVATRAFMGGRTDADGSASFDLHFGELFDVQVYPPGRRRGEPALHLRAVEIEDRVLELVIPKDMIPTGQVSGRLVDGDGDAVAGSVTLRAGTEVRTAMRCAVDSTGAFRFSYVPNLHFTLEFHSSTDALRTLTSDSPLLPHEHRDLGDVVLISQH